MAYDVDDTIAAVASAAGGAARGIVRLSGPDVLTCVSQFWQSSQPAVPLSEIRRATCLTGTWSLEPNPSLSATSQKSPANIEEATQSKACQAPGAPQPASVLPAQLLLWPTNRSYTRQPIAELHTLGSPPLLEAVLRQVCAAGARLAQPGEFTLRAFLAGRLDLPQAEAVLGVIDAASSTQLTTALQQLAGGLSGPLNQLRNDLLNVLADVEAGLDFVDEDIEFISSTQVVERLSKTGAGIAETLNQIQSRNQHDNSVRVLLRGRPNAGKSTLWNALLDRPAAIVSPIPGTTRDYLEADLLLPSGQTIKLIDTAGVDERLPSEIDRQSQDLGSDMAAHADLIILCLDASRPIDTWEQTQLTALDPHNSCIVANKCDLNQQAFVSSLSNKFSLTINDDDPAADIGALQADWQLRISIPDGDPQKVRRLTLVPVSGLNATGLVQLRSLLGERIKQLTAQEMSMVSSTATRCRVCLQRAVDAVKRATELANLDAGQELVAAEIREALSGLAEVVGEVYTDDLLDRIFSRFCIGK